MSPTSLLHLDAEALRSYHGAEQSVCPTAERNERAWGCGVAVALLLAIGAVILLTV